MGEDTVEMRARQGAWYLDRTYWWGVLANDVSINRLCIRIGKNGRDYSSFTCAPGMYETV